MNESDFSCMGAGKKKKVISVESKEAFNTVGQKSEKYFPGIFLFCVCTL